MQHSPSSNTPNNQPLGIYNSGRTWSWPIFSGPLDASRHDRDAVGTLSMVMYREKLILVTAYHVIREWQHTTLASPIGTGWRIRPLNMFDWRMLKTGVTDLKKDGDYDLSFAVINPEQAELIESSLAVQLIRASKIMKPFKGILNGYPAKRNNRYSVKNRGKAEPVYYELIHSGVVPEICPPYLKERYTGLINFSWSTDSTTRLTATGFRDIGKAPEPAGVSGGPVFYCEDLKTSQRNFAPTNTVIGFLIEYQRTNKQLVTVMSDILIESLK